MRIIYTWRKVSYLPIGPKKMLGRSCLFLGLLSALLLYVEATSVCVARLHSGDVFVNEGGAIATCAEYGATCALGEELDGTGDAEEKGLQCACDVSEILVPCPACKCNTICPLFNGTSCEGGRITGWDFRNDLIDPHMNHTQALAMDKAFSYPTKVYGWKMRVKNSRSKGGWMLLQVWRPKLGCFNLVASTNFSYRPSRGSGYTDTELPLNEDEWIPVDQGDIIGLFLVNGIKKSVAPLAFGLLTGSAIASDAATATGSSDMLFFSTAANQDPPTELRTVDYDEHTDQFVINVQAMIGPPVEGEKQCLAQQMSLETIVGGDTTPTSNSNLPFDLRLILAPIIFTLLFLILLALGTGIILFLCIRAVLSSRQKNAEREREKIGNVTLDTLERRSVNNIYPPLGLGSLPRCPSQSSGTCGVRNGSCADSIYEAIPDLIDSDQFTTSYSGSLPHTYAVLERPRPNNENCANTVPHFQVQEDIQADPGKSEKRLSTKDELTGQESEEMESEQSLQHSLVAAEISLANGDHPPRCEVGHQEQFETGGGVEEEGVLEREVEREEEFDFDDDEDSDNDDDEDSDNGLKIYAV